MSVPKQKLCTNCGGPGPFGPAKGNKDGLKSICAPCLAKKQRIYAAKNPHIWSNWAAANAEHLIAKDAARYAADPEGQIARVRAWQLANPEAVKLNHLRTSLAKLGLTIEDHEAMFAKQNGICAICPEPLVPGRRGMCVDHCHETDKVRGLLCLNCNVMLGDFREEPRIMQAATEYLHRGPLGPIECKRPPHVGFKTNGTYEGNLWYSFSLTKEKVQEIIAAQGGVCAICKLPLKTGLYTHIDHDAKLGRKFGLRGILCRSCNLGLGHARDNVEILASAIQYLTAHESSGEIA